MALGLLSDRIPETRAWGYGAAMRTFALASYVEDAWLDKAKLIWEYVVHNLLLDDGSYAYRQDTPQSYIRCEAHLFDAFGRLARRLYDRERSSLGSAGYGHETSTMRENCSVRGNET